MGEKTNGRVAVREAMQALQEDAKDREQACTEELKAALKDIGEKHNCVIGAAPLLHDGRIVATISVQAKTTQQ